MSQSARKAMAMVLALSAGVAGCAVGPHYARPTTNLAPFHNLASVSATRPEFPAPTLESWWTGFNEGFKQAANGRSQYDFVALYQRGTRFPREGVYPPLRGTLCQIGSGLRICTLRDTHRIWERTQVPMFLSLSRLSSTSVIAR